MTIRLAWWDVYLKTKQNTGAYVSYSADKS